MLPFFVLLLAVSTSMAQRSPYAPNRTYPSLLPRFRPVEDQDSQDSQSTDDLANRNGAATNAPTEAHGTLNEDKLVSRVAEWPEDRQPFWYKNRQTINNQRQRPVDGNGRGNYFGQQNGNIRKPWRDQSQWSLNNYDDSWNQGPVQPTPRPTRRPTQTGYNNSGMRTNTAALKNQQTGQTEFDWATQEPSQKQQEAEYFR